VGESGSSLTGEVNEDRGARADWVASIVHDGPDAITAEGLDGSVLYWNSGAERLYGWSPGEVLGRSASAIVPNDQADEWRHTVSTTVASGTSEALETTRLRKDDTVVEVSMSVSPLRETDGQIVGVATIARDISPQKALERELAWRATHDPLTGLANRRHLHEEGPGRIARLTAGPGVVALAFVDVDGLKLINDGHGHATGDHLLCSVARRVGALARDGVFARIGGDEFVLVTDRLDDALEAVELADRLVSAAGHRLRGRVAVDVSVSVGLAVTDDPDTAFTDLLSRGDAAMYRAKAAGGDCYRLARPIRRERAAPGGGPVIDLR
jgi:diguanylate cyclase (GGDEF)-like protein/PAS domain S-box-containing protein